MCDTFGILRPHGVLLDIFADDRPKATQHFHFGVAHHVGVE